MSESGCAICLGEIVPSNADDPCMTLWCGHVYHQVCIKSLCDARDVDVTLLSCPVCKNTSADMQRLENRLGHSVIPQSWEAMLEESPPCGQIERDVEVA